MPDYDLEILQLAEEFESCRRILLALGDETRQHLILKMRREGTKNYYYFDADADADAEAMNRLIHMLEHARQFMGTLPDRSGEL